MCVCVVLCSSIEPYTNTLPTPTALILTNTANTTNTNNTYTTDTTDTNTIVK
eukprot:m.6645 g.6645  ORF g.6645 m.6645 type:complete len:52 (-) comp5307_c0_seq1:28-183(-)